MPPRQGRKRKASSISKSELRAISIRNRSVGATRKAKRARRASSGRWIPPSRAISFTSHGAAGTTAFSIPEGIELVKFTRVGQLLAIDNIRAIFTTLNDHYQRLLRENWKTAYAGKYFQSAKRDYGTNYISVYQAGDRCPNQFCEFNPDDWWVHGFYDTSKSKYDFDMVYDREQGKYLLKDVRIGGFLPHVTRDFKNHVLGIDAKFGTFYLKDLVQFIAGYVPKDETWRLYFFACEDVQPGMPIDMDVEAEQSFEEVLGLLEKPVPMNVEDEAGRLVTYQPAPPVSFHRTERVSLQREPTA